MTDTEQALPRAERMARVRRMVVKIGSSSLADARQQLHRPTIRRLVQEVCELREAGVEVAIVSSGAVAAGMGRLGLQQRPRAIGELQAAAAVGQNLLVHAYESLFRRRGVAVGQVLLTAGDVLDDRQRYLNLRNTFRQLFRFGAVPVINENDSVSVAELKRDLGDNDMLAAYVANLVQAELLVLLSDVEGLYRSYRGGHGEQLISEATPDDDLGGTVGRSAGQLGRGGMGTKVRAAQLMMACGEMTVIAHARRHRLQDIVAGQAVGTLFQPRRQRMSSRKRWIAFASPPQGTLVVDTGAVEAIARRKGSLLPAGILRLEGVFEPGAVVRVADEHGREVARGLSRYRADEIARVLGRSSPEAARILERSAAEIIHRDDLVLT